jgi:hypothetical protein
MLGLKNSWRLVFIAQLAGGLTATNALSCCSLSAAAHFFFMLPLFLAS